MYKQCTRPKSAANVKSNSHGALGRILGALLRHSSATSKRRPTDAQHHPKAPLRLPFVHQPPAVALPRHRDDEADAHLRRHLRELRGHHQRLHELQRRAQQGQLHALWQQGNNLSGQVLQPHRTPQPVLGTHHTVRSRGGTLGSTALGSPASSFMLMLLYDYELARFSYITFVYWA